jgi:predicted transposase YbfD/YdcC
MPHHNTLRRVFKNILDEAEFGHLMQAYQQPHAGGGEQLAMDGKTLWGTRIGDQKPADQLLRVYDVQEQCVTAQTSVDHKENEIVAALRILEQVSVAGKIITADPIHAQRALSAQIVERGRDYLWLVKENQERLYQDMQRLFAPDKPKPGFGKIITDFQQANQKIRQHRRAACGRPFSLRNVGATKIGLRCRNLPREEFLFASSAFQVLAHLGMLLAGNLPACIARI